MAVDTVAPGDPVASEDHNKLAGLFNGTTGYGQPSKFYELNDSTAYSVIAGNQDTTNGYAFKAQYGALSGTPTTLMTVAKALTQITNPFQALGVSASGKGGIGIDSNGVVQMGGEVGSGHGTSANVLAISRTSSTSVSEGMITADFHNRMGTGADVTSMTLRGSEGNLTNYSASAGPSDNFVVLEIRPVFATQSGVIANGHGKTRRGIGVGFQTQTAAANADGSLAHKEVGIYLDASAPGAFVESPANGTGPNAGIFIGGSNPNASTTACAWEWGLVMSGTGTFDSTPIFGIYKDGRTGIARVPTSSTRRGMLQINQDTNNDEGAGVWLFKNGSQTNYTSVYHDTTESTVLTTTASGVGTNLLTLRCNNTLVACTLTAPASQSGNLMDLAVSGVGTVWSWDSAGIPNWVTANGGTGAGGGGATLGNVSASSSTGPTTTGRTEWIKIKYNGNLRWIPAWT